MGIPETNFPWIPRKDYNIYACAYICVHIYIHFILYMHANMFCHLFEKIKVGAKDLMSVHVDLSNYF
jgi:hypothetical protein